MTKKISLTILAAAAGASMALAGVAQASGSNHLHYKKVEWSFEGPFGSYDKGAVQRGFQVYKTVCHSCHAVEELSFRNLGEKGGPFYLDHCPEGIAESVDCSIAAQNPIVKAIAAEYQVEDGPDDTGVMFMRDALPSDKIPGPYANEQQARAANGGAYPPDLALIIKAREDGPNYVYSLLTGFEPKPSTVNISATQHYNPYFAGDMAQFLKPEYKNQEGHPLPGVDVPPGGVLAMAPPLSDGIIDYADQSVPQTVDQYAHDVVQFLAWASEPKMEQRKSLGIVTMGYLFVLTLILFFSYRQIWSRVDH